MRRACRDDEMIIADLSAGCLDDPTSGVDALGVKHEHGDIGAAAHDITYRPSDVGSCERSGRNLVKQRLETMMVLSVEKQDPRAAAGKRLRC